MADRPTMDTPDGGEFHAATRGRERPERLLETPVALTVGRCLACRSFVLADVAHVRSRGDVMHADCGLLRPGLDLRKRSRS